MTTILGHLVALRRLAVAFVLGAVLLLVWAVPAWAQVAPDGDVSPDAPASAYLTVNNTLVLLLTGAVLPLVNGLLLRPDNPRWVKVLVAGMVAAFTHAVSQVVQADGTAVFTQEWVLGLVLTWAGMFGAYYGIWKPAVDPNAVLPTLQPPPSPPR
jgi:hypothetical protein